MPASRRLSELIERLRPLAGKRRGMRIEADEWNALVDTLRGVLEIELAQAAGPDTGGVVPDHQHLGAVGVDWLDADLEARVGNGSTVGGAVGAVTLDARLQRLSSELAQLQSAVEDQRARIDRVLADTVDRTATITDLEGRFANVVELRPQLRGLERRLGALSGSVEQVEEFRRTLLDAQGQAIDVAGLRDEVLALRQLRESLEGPDGRLVRVQDLQARIAEVATLAGAGGGAGPGGGDLDTRIDRLGEALRERLHERLTADLDDRVATVQAASEERAEALRSQLLGDLDARVTAARDESVRHTDEQVAGLDQRLRGELASGLEATVGQLRQEVPTLAAAELDGRLADLPDRISSEVTRASGPLADELRTGLDARLDERVAAGVAGALGPALEPVRAEVGALDGRVGSIESGLDATVAVAVQAHADQLVSDVDARVGQRFDEARAALETTVTGSVAQAVQAAVGDVDGRVSAVVDARLGGVDALINTRVETALAGLPDAVREEVTAHVASLDLQGQLTGLRGDLTGTFQTELAAAVTRLDADRSTAIAEAVTSLRQDLEATRASTLAETTRLVEANRQEIENRLTTEINTTRLDLTSMVNRIPVTPIVGPHR